MKQVVSITSQGQLTIPKAMLDSFGIKQGAKAIVRKEGKLIIVEPKKDFWTLSGSLKSSVRLSARQLKQARKAFGRQWARNI